ncbi:AMP-binding protein [Variovorax guangxiensis]|uniref:class I adenylate-forming enzyme family protein n=1 Tax=Variovorax guangxiensis TaxID=1775474 RepID=UPI00285B7883|nr:AMP-binding protein [Variovorax guangxiensis]MDR6858494.1 acyl-CoA synthetase (AMP-forming)/AMP-acid ligase II [Variovorax guangxiensis]
MTTFLRIHDVPAWWASRTPDAVALLDAGKTLGYAQLQSAIDDARAALAGLGIARGHRVLLVAENSLGLVAFVFAASSLGASFVLVNARLSAEEIDAIAAHAQAQAEIYIDAGFKEGVIHALRRGAASLDCGLAGQVRANARAHAFEPTSEAGMEDVGALIYTSGTTGKPKGVMLTHTGLLFVATTLAAYRKMSPADRSYAVLPMSHTMGLTSVLLGTLVAGGSVLVSPRFEVEALVEAIETQGLSLFQGVQAMHSALLAHLRRRGHTLSRGRLRYIYAGGSPLDPTLKAEVEALFSLPLHNGYGMTENSPTICHSRFGEQRDDASVGPPIPGVAIRIVDAEGKDVAAGESGELWASGPGVMRGYFRDPDSTQAALCGEWLRTGDIARQDAEGNVFLVGRIKEIIIRSGFNVYPAEVEAALNAHPAVAQSAVVGREVERNEEVIAFVQRRPGHPLDDAMLQAFLKERISPYKRPSHIVYLDALPVMTSGKVQRAALKAMASTMLLHPETVPSA